MQYLCLIYFDERKLTDMPTDELRSFQNECDACAGVLRENHHMLTGAQLQETRTATTVRVRGGQLSATDGPFAETKEQLGGFCLLDARDLNEAIQVAALMPPARIGSVEIRPIKLMVELPEELPLKAAG